ncbi:SPOR domain-containing protein [Chromobacterium paludis]|uniref:SPOR domain-containing protein n=1 Tax=Chromobacterium paludis TaxID=2605945 RepID=A0A5C1DHS7_9NEIS|nr:SPOR domain-containing protein [Chromobacterium paludis]QEL56260.1 SPOR domain-containing protein [Chromobacterium paludis]
MREQDQLQAPQDGHNDPDLNSKLKKRLWIAGGLVAVAVAAIPLMDALNKPKVEMSSDAPTPSSGKIIKPAASPDVGSITLPKTASAPTAQSSEPVAQSGAPASPAESQPAAPDLSKTPAIASQQAAPHHAAPRPAHGSEEARPTPPPPATAKEATANQASPQPHSAAANTATATQATPPIVDNTSTAKVAPTPSLSKAEPVGSSVGYQVQLGLFASMGNAQKLVRDLQKHGIAAHTITRVQVGPFKNRAEAEETMKKLRELGYAPLLSANGQ